MRLSDGKAEAASGGVVLEDRVAVGAADGGEDGEPVLGGARPDEADEGGDGEAANGTPARSARM